MHFPQRDDPSSEDSDDVIPPTPAAKSTPLPAANRLRKQSSSSSSSSDVGQFETPKIPIHSPSGTDSSSDDDGDLQGTPISRAVNMKREAETEFSSDNDDNGQTTQRYELAAPLGSDRPVHAMSDSEDSDVETPAVQQNHHYQQNRSSDESEEDDEPKHVQAIVVKTERPSTTESSNEDSDAEQTTHVDRRVPFASQESDESSDENAIARHPQQKQNVEMSSDGSDQEEAVQKPVTARANDTSSDDEEVDQNLEFVRPHETEESEDEEDQQKPVTARASKSDEDGSSSEDEAKPALKPVSLSRHIQNVPSKSSDESSEEDEEPLSNLQMQQQHNETSDELSDEDSNVPPKSNPSSRPCHQVASKSSDESSDEESEVPRTIFTNQNSQSNAKVSYYDSSEEEEDEKSDDEAYEQKFNPNNASNSKTELFPAQHQEQSSREQNQWAVPVPASRKRGKSLLEETFKESDHLHVQNACLTVEDIGSDDEVWLFQCPKSMDVNTLKKKTINLVADGDIQLADGPTFKRFQVTPQQNANISVNCLLPYQNQHKFQIANLPVKGKVVIKEHVHVPKLRMPDATPKGPVPFPTGLKVRHPLLGIGFEKHIAEAKKTQQENAIRQKQNSKKRKQSSENVYLGEKYVERDSLNQSLQSSNLLNGKRTKKITSDERSNDKWSSKKKKSQLENESFTSSFRSNTVDGSFLNNTYAKNKKSSKKEREMRESCQNEIESNLNDEGSSKKQKKNSARAQNAASHSLNESLYNTSLQKKKSKSKTDEQNEETRPNNRQTARLSWHTPQTDETPVSVSSKEDSSFKKKKKKHSKELLHPLEIKQEKSDGLYINETSDMHSFEVSHSKKRKRKESDHGGIDLDSSQISSKRMKHIT